MAATQAKLDVKLAQLRITVEKTNSVFDSNRKEVIERHRTALKTITDSINGMRLEVEESKIEAKVDMAEITTWNGEIDAKLSEADNEIERLRKWLEGRKQVEDMAAREEQFTFEAKLHETRMKFQEELTNAKVETLTINKENTKGESSASAKLPKLVISKFNGNLQDWQRFWGQFTEAVDKSSIPPITKFTYLCELLDPKIKHVIDSLPFTAEGYNRAKAILQDRYGKESEIIKSYVKEIMDLPHIPSANPKKILEFSERLNHCVQALQTMNKLSKVDGNVAMTLDKLPCIRGDLVRTDPDWESWTFAQLSEAVRQWTTRNPIDPRRDRDNRSDRDRVGHSMSFHAKSRECVYCGDVSHKAGDCTKITNVSERKKILAKKRLCFNCAIGSHRAAECTSKGTCRKCGKRHHTSICDTPEGNEKKTVLTTNHTSEGVLPVIIIKVNGVKCRALIDTGSGSSYISAKLVDVLQAKPISTQTRQVEMLMASKSVRMDMFDLNTESVDGQYQMPVKFIKVNKQELLSVENPHYADILRDNAHLSGVEIEDNDAKSQLPVHVIFGSGEYARIKTETKPQIGKDGDPIGELTKMGWFIMSPGTEFDRSRMLLTQTSQSDYEGLCRMDILGLADAAENDQGVVHAEFKEQLRRDKEGWYETGLPWRANHPKLPNNEQGSLYRLERLERSLERRELTAAYDEVIQNQIKENIVEKALVKPMGREFYLPHKPVVREAASSTKLRVVYDASASASPDSPSLNDCLNPGQQLLNRLWDVLVRQRVYPVAVTGDIRQAFLQIRVREAERDALRFHWRSSQEAEIETYRFTRVLFGLAPSPFLLNGVLEAHLDSWEKRCPDTVNELRKSLYVDDLLSGGQTTEQAQRTKLKSTEILQDATFQLHKWCSNVPELEEKQGAQTTDEQTYAKQQLDASQQDSKILGLKWNKQHDTLSVVVPKEEVQPTKRGVLKKIARIYDPLGLIAPVTLEGKQIYREVCDSQKAWDVPMNKDLQRRWKKWEEETPSEYSVPRSITRHREDIDAVDLHVFSDASTKGVGAAVYSVIHQPTGTTQQLVAAKSRLAKKSLTIPRLELVGAHMATNLLINVRNALDNIPTPRLFEWVYSTVALHWTRGNGQYKQFIANRVAKIQLHDEITWRYVPTGENPADLASRGGQIKSETCWKNGPEWLPNEDKWPENLVTQSSQASEAEAKAIREILSVVKIKEDEDEFDSLLERVTLRRTLRVGARIRRLIRNRRNNKKEVGPITTEEVTKERDWWIQRVQERERKEPHYPKVEKELGLRTNVDDLLVCHGRIQGQYPIYLPRNAKFTEKLVHRIHVETLHGGVSLSMAAVRERYWIPRLRSLVKIVRNSCNGCKRFRATAMTKPALGALPETRTTIGGAFEVIGTDFAGPIKYQLKKGNKEAKSYLCIFSCSLSRAIHLELLPNMETDTFIPCLKRLIARRGRPRIIYSDNGGTFIKAAKWISKLRKSERLQGLLEQHEITWRFNLSRAPWWGGQFERLIAVVKSAMYKVIGNGILTWAELSEVLLDVETQINRRPLSYVEDDLELPTLTPETFLFQRTSHLPEEETWTIDEGNLRKRAKFLKACKDGLWRRWQREYLTALRERHNLTHKASKYQPKEGDLVIVKTDSKNRGTWPLAVVTKTFVGKDEIIRGVELKTGKGTIERPVQLLYPLELACDEKPIGKGAILNPEAPEFRPKRAAAATANARIRQIQEIEEDI